MPISPAPPSARNSSSSLPGRSAMLAAAAVALEDLDEAAHGDLGLVLVDRGRGVDEERRQPARRHDEQLLAGLGADTADDALDQPDIAPEDARLHRAQGVLADGAARRRHGDA